jgi:AGZA family xanthine/uracil permease-like MFS transporter
LSFIGLRNAGFIEADSTTLVRFAGISVELGLSIVGLLCTVFLIRAKKAYAMIIAIAVVTILALTLGRVSVPHVYFELPDFNSVFLKFDPWGALRWEYV